MDKWFTKHGENVLSPRSNQKKPGTSGKELLPPTPLLEIESDPDLKDDLELLLDMQAMEKPMHTNRRRQFRSGVFRRLSERSLLHVNGNNSASMSYLSDSFALESFSTLDFDCDHGVSEDTLPPSLEHPENRERFPSRTSVLFTVIDDSSSSGTESATDGKYLNPDYSAAGNNQEDQDEDYDDDIAAIMGESFITPRSQELSTAENGTKPNAISSKAQNRVSIPVESEAYFYFV